MPLLDPPSTPWIVQKYGGTSLGNLLPTITGTVIPQYLRDNKIAIVCSAISGVSKRKGTTSLLLDAIDAAVSLVPGGSELEVERIVGLIRDEHLELAGKLGCMGDVEAGVRSDCGCVLEVLRAAQTIGELSPCSRDRIISFGEKLACRLVVASLQSSGIKAKMIVLNDIVSSAYGDDTAAQARAYEELGPRFFDALATEIGKRVAEVGDAVPVITGFFGMMPNSLLQSVGRGYSDLCGAMVAATLSAKELQIWKEVDGIFTADPRKVPSARLLNTITLEEAAELTYYGSEVIHPFTMDQIRQANIPLRIKNVSNPDGRGTIIFPSNESGSGDSSPGSGSSTPSLEAAIMKANGYYGPSKHRRASTALTTKSDILLVNVQSNRQTKSHGFLAQVFAQLNSLSVVVDLITSSEASVSLALGKVENRKDLVEGLERCGKVEILSGMAIVSVIGHRMRNVVGIAGQLFSTLASGGVNIYLIAQGASEINISLVVKESDAQVALDLIHANVLGIPRVETHVPIVQNSLMKGPWLF